MLTGKEIFEKGILINALPSNIQQQGIDVRVENIRKVWGENGKIPCEGKTTTALTAAIEPLTSVFEPKNITEWHLAPGYYELEFMEGCEIPANCCLQFKTRSSLVRCGANVFSGLFDAGFKTQNMGAFMKLELPLIIEKGARLAQVLVEQTAEVENTYNGQFQNDKQRNNAENTK